MKNTSLMETLQIFSPSRTWPMTVPKYWSQESFFTMRSVSLPGGRGSRKQAPMMRVARTGRGAASPAMDAVFRVMK